MLYSPYSVTKLQTFDICRKQFFYRYVAKVKVDDTFSDPYFFKKGRFAHYFIAQILKGISNPDLGSPDVKAEDKEHLIDRIYEAFENDEYLNCIFKYDKTIVEKKVDLYSGFTLDKDLEKLSTGFIDFYAVHGKVAAIIDWKSGYGIGKKSPDYDQLIWYGIWLAEKYPEVEEIDLGYFFIESGTLDLLVMTREELFAKRELFSCKINTIETEKEFEKTEGDHCKWCPYIGTCGGEND